MAVIAAIGAQQIGADRAGEARTIELERDERAGLAVVVPARSNLGTDGFGRAIVGEMDAPVRRAVVPGKAGRHEPQRHIERERAQARSEEHTSELQSLMRISYAVFCLKKKTNYHIIYTQ